jgi:hypothetical protein
VADRRARRQHLNIGDASEMAKALKRRARQMSLSAMIGLFLMTPCIAEPLTLEVSAARAGYDQRTGRPTLKISLAGISKQAIYYLSLNNIGRKAELRIDGKTVLTPFFREPLSAGSMEISGDDLTAEKIQGLVDELSRPGIRVEIETPPE